MGLTSRFRIVLSSRHPFKLLFAFILRKLKISSFFIIDKGYYRLKFYSSAILMHYWANTLPSKDFEIIFLSKFIKYGATVLDIGANVGSISIPLSYQVGKNGLIISVEANPLVYKYLCGNIEFNRLSNVKTFNTAIGEKKGKAKFSNISSDDMNKILNNENCSKNSLEVTMTSIDALLENKNIDSIRLLKIDIEGYELFALKGAKNILQITEIIYIESFEEHFKNYGYSTIDLLHLLKSSGFFIFRFDNDCLIEIDCYYISYSCENLIAVKNKSNLENTFDQSSICYLVDN